MKYIFLLTVFCLISISCSDNEVVGGGMADSHRVSKVSKNAHSTTSKQNTFFSDSSRRLQITENSLDIDWVYQTAWNNKKRINKIDSSVKKLLKCGIRDSLIIDDYIDELAATQTADAYCFLFICCCQFYNIKHVTPFQSYIELLRKYGKPYVALNKYYLNNSISRNLSDEEFADQVIAKCYKNLPECYYLNH